MDLMLDSFQIDTLVLRALEDDEWSHDCPLVRPSQGSHPLDPVIILEQTDYDQGEIIDGMLNLQPSSTPENWNTSLQIIYQIVGPIGGAEKLYYFESEDPHTNGSGHFYLKVPDLDRSRHLPGHCPYNGLHLPSSQVEVEFTVNGIRATVLTALMEPSR